MRAALVLAAVALVYAPSLGGDWVWDDVYQYAENPAIGDPWTLVRHDLWETTGRKDPDNVPVYRPLAMLSHVPGQRLLPGPAVERVLNLALHLAVVALVALVARSAGAGADAAWLGAALFGLHPGVTEGVAWISSRGDLLGTMLLLGAALALWREREGAAGALLALAPFCKETFLFAPLALGLVLLGRRRLAPRALAGAVGGALAYLILRWSLDIPLPGAGPVDPVALLGAVGAVAERGLALAFLPTAPDATPPYVAHPVLGAAVLLVGLGLLARTPGRPALALACGALPLLAPAAPASLGNGVVADRYFYVAFALAAPAAAIAASPWLRRRPVVLAAAGLACALAPFSVLRAWEWTSNARLFGAALARHPDGAEALYQVAFDLHTREGDCERAAPLYGRAMGESPRAANNLLACWRTLGRFEEVARIGPGVAARSPGDPKPASNVARALLALGNAPGAEQWIREALRRAPPTSERIVLLGHALGMQGRHAEALAAFDRALALDPDSGAAFRGREIALSHGAAP